MALTINTEAYPPQVLLVRGTARVEILDEVALEYLAASRRNLDEEQARAFEGYAREAFKHMARIRITPDWAKLLDFSNPSPQDD